jgi:YD repeat-containing protein
MAKYVLVNVYDGYNNQAGVFTGATFPQNSVQQNLTGKLAAEAFRDKPSKNWNYRLYSYDPLGRITEQSAGQRVLTYNYDNLGNIKKININNNFNML